MGIRLIGRKWRTTGETLDGFKVISVELELAVWEDKDDDLFNYMSSHIFGGLPLPGSRLYEAELDEIIRTLTKNPSSVYRDLSRASADLSIFTMVRDWFKKNYPHGWIEFDVC